MTNITTLIVDDEFSNRELIQKMVKSLNPAFDIVGEAKSAAEAFKLINRLKPDLVFLDIKMPVENGFDLLKKFEHVDFEVAFITGFDEYAITAFEYNALDYILKPIDATKFKTALEKIKTRFDNHLSNPHNLKQILKTYHTEQAIITKIPIHHKNKVVLIDLKDLMYIKSVEGCTNFFTLKSEEYISSKKLSDFEFIINQFPNFIRISRSTYINLNALQYYTKGNDCTLILKDGSSFEISRRRKAEVLGLLTKKHSDTLS